MDLPLAMGKRKCVFNVNLQQEYKFFKLCNDSDSEHVQCTLCNGVFSLAHKGRGDIEDHVKTVKHRSAINDTASANIRDFFKDKDGNNSAAIEATFSCHTARHELSFNTSKLVKKLYDPKFSSARTKTEVIIVNVISPFIFDNVLRPLENIYYVTVSMDSSNRSEVKLVPVVVRYSSIEEGIYISMKYQVKVLKF
jgi:hypothetical protein